MRLVQLKDVDGNRRVAVVSEDGSRLVCLKGVESAYALAMEALAAGTSLEAQVQSAGFDGEEDYVRAYDEGRILPPIDHPDPAHVYVTGTGLNHLGSAMARNAMHAKEKGDGAELTDSMKMFQWGMDGGKPEPGAVGVQPEWFYKGNGECIVPPGQPLEIPAFALDGGDEAEVVGVYVIGPDGSVARVGYAVGNEFSDHVMEQQNYLYLAHSKLRNCSLGPELYVGELPEDVTGHVRVVRGGETVWSAPFRTGEANMTHTIANMEHHHFKYSMFRRPGDVHLHYFGASALSFSDGVTLRTGDVVEVTASIAHQPLKNPIRVTEGPEAPVDVRQL